MFMDTLPSFREKKYKSRHVLGIMTDLQILTNQIPFITTSKQNKETSSLDVFPLKLFDSPRIPRLRELLTSTPHPPLDPSTLLL